MAADLESLVGTALGDYTLTAVIGRGPGGVVFAAKHQKLHGLRACKVLSATTAGAPEQVARALRAASLISRLRHPNLIKIYDSDETAGRRPYLIMELLSGQRLDERMQQERLSAELIATLAEQMCAGLAAAHAAALPHLFLKPANVFLLASAPGELTVKLTDFGDWGTVEEPDAVYQAPEQLAGQPGDQRSDVYALGCILYALCAGAPPFAGASAAEVKAAQAARPLPSLSAAAMPAGVAPEIAAVLQRALALKPADRHPTAEALWAELRLCLPEPLLLSATGASHRASQSLVAPASRFTRRRRLGMLAAVGLATGVGALLLWLLRPPPPAPLKTDPQSLRALAEQVLLAGLRQRDPALRQRAAAALSHNRDPRYQGWLEPLLGDPEPTVQAAAARALGAIGAPAAIAALRTCVSDLGTAPRLACAESLQLLGDASRDTEQILDQALRSAAAGSPQAVEILSHRALRGREDARVALEQLLPASGALTEPLLPVIATLLRLGSQLAQALVSAAVRVPGPLQVAAAQLLCAADDPTGQPLLREVVAGQKSPEQVRGLAASGLGSCGDRTDALMLAELLSKPRQPELLRLALAEALLALSSSDPAVLSHNGLAWAEQALSDERWSVRESAALLLGDVDLALVGRLARRGRSTALLLGAAADQDVNVRLAALQSMGKQGARSIAAAAHPAPEERAEVEQLRAAVRTRADIAAKDEREKVRAAVVLEQLGSGSQLPVLQAALRSRDPAVRRFALKEATGHGTLSSQDVAPLLKDDDVQVRFLAASLLAERNDDRGRTVLRAVAGQGGADALRARLLLTTLADEQEPLSAEQISSYARSPDPLVRLSAVEAGLRLLPRSAALALLERLARDVDSVVRFRVAEAVSGFLVGSERLAGRRILRRMLRDTDAAVRARAGLFLASDEELNGRPGTGEKGRDKPAAPEPVHAETEASQSAEASGARGKGGSAEARTAAQIKNLLSQISGALARRDYQKAELALQRASALCRQQPSKNAACARTMPTLSFQLATLYEKQQKWSLAFNEYERTRQLATTARELRAESDKAIARLSKQLGHLLIYKPVSGKCKRVELWMQPGNQRFAVNGQTRSVLLSAGETAEIRTCK